MKKFLGCLAILAFCFVIISCNPETFSRKGQKVTVMIVGLDYLPKGGSTAPLSWGGYSVPKLSGTINDAKELGVAFDSIYSERNIEHELIFMLSEGKDQDLSSALFPTKQNVLNKIASLDLTEDDLFVFYFAGHGFLKTSESTEPPELNLITGERYQGGPCTSITSSELLNAISSLDCRSAVILDACYSGAFDPKNSTSPESWWSSIKNIFKENIVLRENNKISVISAAKWNERSWEGYRISFSDGTYEEHGQFSGKLLSILNWNHSSSEKTTVKIIDGNDVVVNGKPGKIFGSLTLDDIYAKLFDNRSYPNITQYPVFYYNNESIVLIPSN